MIQLQYTDTDTLLHRHKTFIKINDEPRHNSVLDNQFWLVDFADSAERTAEEAALEYRHWLNREWDERPNGPVASKLNQLADLSWNGNEVEVMTFPEAKHGEELKFFLAELVHALGPAEYEVPAEELYPDEFIKRDSLELDPDDETIWTTIHLREDRIVRIIGNYNVMLGVMVSKSEALVPGHDLVPLKEDRWFYDAAAASDEERIQLQQALYQFHHEDWNINERFLSRPEDRFDEVVAGHFADVGLQAFDNEQDAGLLLADEDQEAVERTIIGWYHKRDLAQTTDLAGLGILAGRYSQAA